MKVEHYEHWAAKDLTDELNDAPNSKNIFDKFEIIGN